MIEVEITKDVLKKMNKQKAPFVLIGAILGPLAVVFFSGALPLEYGFWILLLSGLVTIPLYFVIVNFKKSLNKVHHHFAKTIEFSFWIVLNF